MDQNVVFREAVKEDLETIVEMLADDDLGRKRERFENPLPESYSRAFQAIISDPNNELIVALRGDKLIGVQQVTFTPYLTYQGGWRATIEGVRTASSERGKGVGSELICFAIQRAKDRGCHVVQLTTDKKREDALRFYKQLGFENTHEGMKLHL